MLMNEGRREDGKICDEDSDEEGGSLSDDGQAKQKACAGRRSSLGPDPGTC